MTATLSTAQPHNLTAALITQMSIGPAFREVAAGLLREQLQKLYPSLDIDPDIAVVGTPAWAIVDDHVVPAGRYYNALTDLLAIQSVVAIPALYLEGEHFLTQLPIVEPAVHLPVRILDIAEMLNTLAPVILRGYQQTQLAYWNGAEGDSGPRWHSLSTALREFWDVKDLSGWTAADREMANELYRTPDLTTRLLSDPNAVRAYVIDIDEIDAAGKVTHLNEHLISVVIGQQEGRDVILTQSLLLGFKKYSTLELLAKDLPNLLDNSITHKTIQWRLLEPDGDFFDYLACAFVSLQVAAIGAIDFSDLREPDAPQKPLASPPTPQSTVAAPDLQPFIHALPEWLTSASDSDQNTYSRYLKDLAALHSSNQGQSYQDGISPIQEYALDVLNAQMRKDHPNAAPQLLEDLDIGVKSPVLWGLFPMPGQFDTSVFSVAELALQNLIALPIGVTTLRKKSAQALPDWLTFDYLKTLISRADIGNAYPALIKQKLLADPQESKRRQTLYAQHLRLQLPLLALQCKIRDEAGIDELGFRYVVAVMQAEPDDRFVQGQPIVMRPLAFEPTRRLDTTQDTVANMFIIGPIDPAAGPCLLYRPLLDQPLSQYPSPTNLIYALQQSASLRDSVLAWLPDDSRNDYAQYVFPGQLPSPWTVVEFVVDPIKLLIMSGPVVLGTDTLAGDQFVTLYNANANALVELADRQSVSNSDARWATFKRAGWMIFNAALPFLGRTVGVAAWIWQIMDQLQNVVDAQAHPEQQSPWAALTDLLLNIGMALTLHSVSRNAPRREFDAPAATKLPRPIVKPKTPIIKKLATITSDAQSNHDQPLHTSGAINRTPLRLATVLDSFKVAKPAALGPANTALGAHQHLYGRGQTWYAPVGTRWFQVLVDENDSVLIVDPAQPERTGPPLIHNSQGQWFVDTRLRLRGGGPKYLTRKAQALALKRAQELRLQLDTFEKTKKTAQRQLEQTRLAMEAGPSTSAEARRQTYLQTLDNQRKEYESALQKLKELSVNAPTPDYPQKALGYIKAQTKMTGESLREILTRFTPKLRTTLEQIERQAESPQDRHIEDGQSLNELIPVTIEHLEYMQSRFSELDQLGRDGKHLISIIQGTLPGYGVDQLKALRVSISRNLCLAPTSIETAPVAWSTLDQIVNSAEISIQCLQETLLEQSESQLDEQIDTLNSLIEQFQTQDEQLQDFATDFSEHALPTPLQTLRSQLAAYQRQAIRGLGVSTAERDRVRSRPTPPPTPPRLHKKYIRTRFHGQLIGEPRLTDLAKETWLVDVTSPVTSKVIATFHEKTKGVWALRLKTPPTTPSPVDIQTHIRRGQALLDELPAFQVRASARAVRPDRTPISIEQLYHQQAARLEQAANAIEHALTSSNDTESETLPASSVKKALVDAVDVLFQNSNTRVLSAIKQHPPTAWALDWLKQHDAITIKKTLNRRQRGHKADYVSEYSISERLSHEVLWYAEFHYSAEWTPDKAYLSARLKTVEEHRMGAAANTLKGLTSKQRVNFLRSEISLEQARRLFFERPKSESGN
ncbi:hypothetical protein BFW87_10920 [Pseudomonas fluorescens]|uniref:Uncharacterized protein n=1 Tax=Pseudomonas fluorescens TaxID=294 RepID=A0A1T2YYG4_PSEFL|nr:hypothetical protein [Pseudomonas fluorescens]OPA96826.1 hypothetical protein BFW87_10920 [Pseudomonas fluorescens]